LPNTSNFTAGRGEAEAVGIPYVLRDIIAQAA
jgi:hypothetical protein